MHWALKVVAVGESEEQAATSKELRGHQEFRVLLALHYRGGGGGGSPFLLCIVFPVRVPSASHSAHAHGGHGVAI